MFAFMCLLSIQFDHVMVHTLTSDITQSVHLGILENVKCPETEPLMLGISYWTNHNDLKLDLTIN